jgi:hypothetical protein
MTDVTYFGFRSGFPVQKPIKILMKSGFNESPFVAGLDQVVASLDLHTCQTNDKCQQTGTVTRTFVRQVQKRHSSDN